MFKKIFISSKRQKDFKEFAQALEKYLSKEKEFEIVERSLYELICSYCNSGIYTTIKQTPLFKDFERGTKQEKEKILWELFFVALFAIIFTINAKLKNSQESHRILDRVFAKLRVALTRDGWEINEITLLQQKIDLHNTEYGKGMKEVFTDNEWGVREFSKTAWKNIIGENAPGNEAEIYIVTAMIMDILSTTNFAWEKFIQPMIK